LQVNGVAGRLQGSNLDEFEIWQTGPINISSYASISIAMTIGELDALESDDQIFCEYSLNGTTWVTLTNGAFSDDFTSASPYASGVIGTSLFLRVRVINNEPAETHWIDQILIYEMVCPNTPVVLPYTESFESVGPVMTLTTDQSNINGLCNWAFNEVEANGRLQFNVGAAHTGYKAALLDASPTGSNQLNELILTLDMTNYVCANDLTLSFWHIEYSDEDHANDRVWIRGSTADSWIEVYDLTVGTIQWMFSNNIDIDAALSTVGQEVTSTFQVKFGQQDNFSFNLDGRAFDDISINGTFSLSVGGSVNGGNSPICFGDSTGLMTLSGHVGTILKWQKRLNNGAYVDIPENSTTYNEIPSAVGTWGYRAVVQNGNCEVAYSDERQIVALSEVFFGQFTDCN
jgi:hypothetical protein